MRVRVDLGFAALVAFEETTTEASMGSEGAG